MAFIRSFQTGRNSRAFRRRSSTRLRRPGFACSTRRRRPNTTPPSSPHGGGSSVRAEEGPAASVIAATPADDAVFDLADRPNLPNRRNWTFMIRFRCSWTAISSSQEEIEKGHRPAPGGCGRDAGCLRDRDCRSHVSDAGDRSFSIDRRFPRKPARGHRYPPCQTGQPGQQAAGRREPVRESRRRPTSRTILRSRGSRARYGRKWAERKPIRCRTAIEPPVDNHPLAGKSEPARPETPARPAGAGKLKRRKSSTSSWPTPERPPRLSGGRRRGLACGRQRHGR